MSWGKLWVRMKGELLTWKEDLASGGHEGDQADVLLKKLERLFATPSQPENASDRLQDRAAKIAALMEERSPSEIGATGSHGELREAYEELRSLKRAGCGDASHAEDQPAPNPRRLG